VQTGTGVLVLEIGAPAAVAQYDVRTVSFGPGPDR
jgi:hypothetical protein